MTKLVAPIIVALLATAAPAPAATGGFSNPTPITIPNEGKASPYPSQIDVQGMAGRITDVGVSLNGFQHPRPADVDVLLQSPDGKTSIVMSDVCGNAPLTSVGWIFTRDAPGMTGACPGLVYAPTNDFGADDWPFAANRPFWDADFDHFIGQNPNGVWRLWVVDDDGHDVLPSGSMGHGWSLQLTTEPADVVVPGSDDGKASPYPATRAVSDLQGVIKDVDVSLSGVHHERANDLQLLLVGPGGQSVGLMDRVCGFDPLRGASWRWDDEAAQEMPVNDCPTGVYRPTDRGDALPAPAPSGPYAKALSALDGTDPNGEWRLYAYDYRPTDTLGHRSADGFLSEPFQLHIETRPKAPVGFAASALTVPEGQTRGMVLARSGDGLGAGSVKVTSAPGSASEGGDYEPLSTRVQFAAGERTRTVPVTVPADRRQEGAETFTVRISDATGDARPGAAATVTIPANGTSGARSDTVAPAISHVSLAPRMVSPGHGVRVRYTLSEPASVTLRLTRRHKAARTLRRSGHAGANRARIGHRALHRGRYRVVLTAVDAAGNVSAPRSRRFRVVRPKRSGAGIEPTHRGAATAHRF